MAVSNFESAKKWVRSAVFSDNDLWRYLLRLVILLWIWGRIWLPALKERQEGVDEYGFINTLSGLDLFHALFYAVLPAVIILLFIPRRFFEKLNKPIGWPIAFGLAIIPGLLPVWALNSARADYRLSYIMGGMIAYLALNVALWVFWSVIQKKRRARIATVLKKAVLVADFIAPVLVWASYRKKGNILYLTLRAIPAAMVCSGIFLALLFQPPSLQSMPALAAGFSKINNGRHYHVDLDNTGKLVALSFPSILFRIDPQTGFIEKRQSLDEWKAVSFDMEKEKKRLFLFTNQGDESRFFQVRASDLEIIDSKVFKQSMFPMFEASSIFWQPDRGIYLDVGESGILKTDSGGAKALRGLNVQPSHSVLDPNRPVFYLCFLTVPGVVSAHNTDTLAMVHSLEMPKYATRMAIDGPSYRLFIVFPVEGIVRVIDLKTFAFVDTISSFPGVRWGYIDEARRLLFLGGFAPFLEIRSADDYRLIARLVCPAWTRGMVADPKTSIAYIASEKGLYRLDFTHIQSPGMTGFLHQLDPFFRLTNLALPFARYLRHMDLAPDAGPLPKPVAAAK